MKAKDAIWAGNLIVGINDLLKRYNAYVSDLGNGDMEFDFGNSRVMVHLADGCFELSDYQ